VLPLRDNGTSPAFTLRMIAAGLCAGLSNYSGLVDFQRIVGACCLVPRRRGLSPLGVLRFFFPVVDAAWVYVLIAYF